MKTVTGGPGSMPAGERPAGRGPSEAAGLLRNSFFILLSRGIQLATSFFVVVAVARYLSIDQYGEYSFIVAYVSSIMALAYFGIQQVLIREIALDREAAARIMGVALRLRTLLSAVAVVIIAVSLLFMKLPRLLIAGSAIAIASEFFLSLSLLSKAVFQAFERMVYEPAITIVSSVALACGIGSVIYLDLGFLPIFGAAALANLAQLAAASFIISRRFTRPSSAFDGRLFRKFLGKAVVIGVGVFLYQNLFKINVLLLRWFGSVQDVAFFNAPHSLLMQIQVVPMSLVMAVFPVFSRLMRSDRERLLGIYDMVFRGLFVFSSGVAVVLGGFPREVVGMVFGGRYDPSAQALLIMAWATIPLTMDMLLNAMLIAMDKQRYAVFYAGAALVFNILAGAFVIPKHGFLGASVLSVVSNIILFSCSLFFVSRNGLPLPVAGMAARTAGAAAVAMIVIVLLKPVSPVAAGAAGVVLFAAAVVATRVFTVEEIFLLKKRLFEERRG